MTTLPAYQNIKNHILNAIHNGVWKEGEAIPAEMQLAKQFGVSRMTVNRAMRELTAEQIVIRIQGSGTYVAQQKYQTTLVEIKSIADEIRARGHIHRSELQELSQSKASDTLKALFELKTKSTLYHSLIVHFENDTPIQVEDRWVNAAIAPDYLKQDFSGITANEYLMMAAPLQGVDYQIEAITAPEHIAALLHISTHEPCLVLHRKTRSMGCVASIATMWHAGTRYRFSGGF